jgi:hypothetical protein
MCTVRSDWMAFTVMPVDDVMFEIGAGPVAAACHRPAKLGPLR